MEAIIQSLNIVDYINVGLVLFLLGLGFIIKHLVNKIPNNKIPIILYIIAIIYEIVMVSELDKAIIVNAIVDGTIAAAIAIGLHNSGKRLIKSKSFITLLSNLSSNPTEDEYTDEYIEECEDEE